MKKRAVKMKNDAKEKDMILESAAPGERIRELAALAFFTLIAAAASVIVMDLIVFPVTIFAVNNKNAYNIIFKYSFLIIVISFLLFVIIRKIMQMKKDGFPASEIILHIAKRPLSYAGTALAFILISAALIAVIYLLLNLNYVLLSKIIGS